jgi:hypothetical protein
MRKLGFIASMMAAAALATAPVDAEAQFRTIPTAAKRGTLRHVQEMVVEINGTQMKLAAGAQIRDHTNLIIVPAALPQQSLVKFTVDPSGHVTRIWILSREEAAQPDPR